MSAFSAIISHYVEQLEKLPLTLRTKLEARLRRDWGSLGASAAVFSSSLMLS
jgi:hypothetical protein